MTETESAVTVIEIVTMTLNAEDIVMMWKMRDGIAIPDALIATDLDRLLRLSDLLADTAVSETMTKIVIAVAMIVPEIEAVTVKTIARDTLVATIAEIEMIDVIETGIMIVAQVVIGIETDLQNALMTANIHLMKRMAAILVKMTARTIVADATSTTIETVLTAETEPLHLARHKTSPIPKNWRKNGNANLPRCNQMPTTWKMIDLSVSLKSLPRKKNNARLMTGSAQTVVDSCLKYIREWVKTVWMSAYGAAVVICPRWRRNEV